MEGLVRRCAIIARSVRSMAFDTLNIGDGIVLTKVQPEDAEDVFALIDSNRFPWVDPAKGVEATLDFIERSLKQDEEKNGFQCCIRLEGKIIGRDGVREGRSNQQEDRDRLLDRTVMPRAGHSHESRQSPDRPRILRVGFESSRGLRR